MRYPILILAIILSLVVLVDATPAATGYGDSNVFSLNTAWITPVPEGTPTRDSALLLCHPNPFNPVTKIRVDLPVAALVRLAIYDLRGCLIRTLLREQPLPAGCHEVVWDGHDRRGVPVVGGVYLCRLATENFQAMVKLTALK